MRNSFCILLTATIEPNNMTFTRRADPKIRERDYIEAIAKLCKSTDLPIVFVENSGYDLSKINQAFLDNCRSRFELIRADKPDPALAYRGKGYGEYALISDALDRSLIMKDCTHIIKITGRYTIVNLKEIIEPLKTEDFLVAAHYPSGDRYAMSGIFAFQKEFFYRYFDETSGMIDDSKKRPFEMALRTAIENAVKDGKRFIHFSAMPIIDGYSGTWNAKFKKDNYNDVQFSFGKILIMMRKIRQAIERRWNILLNMVYTDR